MQTFPEVKLNQKELDAIDEKISHIVEQATSSTVPSNDLDDLQDYITSLLQSAFVAGESAAQNKIMDAALRGNVS